MLLEKFEDQDKEDDDVFAAMPKQDFPIPAMNIDEDDMDSRNYLADKIQPKI